MKSLRLYAGIAALLILLTGCGKKEAGEVSENAQTKTVYGEIYEVVGNSITIKTIEMPQRPTGEDGQPITGEHSTMATDENGDPIMRGGFQRTTDENGEYVRSGGFQRTTDENGDIVRGGGNFQMPTDENGDPAWGNGTFQMPTDENGDPVGRTGGMKAQLNYTGEQVDVIIPVGIKITSSTYGGSDGEEKEIELTDLEAGQILSVTYAADGNTVEKVSVIEMNSRAVGGNFMFGDSGMKPQDNMPQG